MIGRKSLFAKFKINGENVLVQANKNHSVCDIVFNQSISEPKKPVELTKESMAKYRKEKLAYDIAVRDIKSKRQAFLNKFQGKQLTDTYIVERISNFLENETKI